MNPAFENGARPVTALGLPVRPLGRLGALVFQPDNTQILSWADPQVATRIAGCATGLVLTTLAGKTFSVAEGFFRSVAPPAKSTRHGFRGGAGCQGIARAARPRAPGAALHLDSLRPLEKKRLGFCVELCFNHQTPTQPQ